MRFTTGTALPVCLTLLTLMTLLGVATMRLAVSNAHLAGAIMHGDEAFRAAGLAINRSLATVATQPALLPTAGSITLPAQQTGGASEIHVLGTATCDAFAPAAGIRTDYELRVTATAARNASSHQRLRFHVCREACTALPCTAAETSPVRSHWFVTRPDLP